MVCLVALKLWHGGAHIYCTGVAEVACRLQYLAFLSVVQRQRLHIIQRELPEIYLPVLGIAQGYAIVHYAGMIGAHRADVDGLYAANASVILDLYAREIAQGVCHAIAGQTAQLLAGKCLHRNNLGGFPRAARGHYQLVQRLDAVAPCHRACNGGGAVALGQDR